MRQFGIASFKFDMTLSGSFTYFKFPMCSIFKLVILFRDSNPSSVTLGQSTTSSQTNWLEQVADKYFNDLSLMYLKRLEIRVSKLIYVLMHLQTIFCYFLLRMQNCKITQGPSINDVGSFFRIYEPPSSPCRPRLLNRLM